MSRIVAMALCGALLALIAAGCKSQPKMAETPMTGTYEEPLWVTKEANAFPEEAGKAFYAVGIAEKRRVPYISLRRKTAVETGRGDVPRQTVLIESVQRIQ